MVKEEMFSVCDFAVGITEAIDLVSAELNDHHKKVAYISYQIAKEMKLPEKDVNDIIMAALLHDIGVFTVEEQTQVITSQFEDSTLNTHPEIGYRLLRNFEPFAKAALLIRHHHAHYDKPSGGHPAGSLPIGSYIVHLADRLFVLFDKDSEILGQIPHMMKRIEENASVFHPGSLAALRQIAGIEYYWIEASFIPLGDVLHQRLQFTPQTINLDELLSLAKVISQIIDFRSRFTATHSSGVAAVAAELTKICGFSEKECKLMEIAGYMHDIGKLAISNDILEKTGALDHKELNEMRKHSFFTYAVLSKIKGFEQIAMWAAFHHERLDGRGYPFHVRGENFSKLARIMAVADILTAITEDRPYRQGMESGKAIEVLTSMVDNGGIDQGAVDIVKNNFARINEVRVAAQKAALQEYVAFYS